MRDALQLLDGQRLTVQATVLRHGGRIAWTGITQPTILLGDVTTPDAALLASHLWLDVGRRLAALDLHAGDVVQFSGRVRAYHRRATAAPEHRRDFHLSYPTRCTVLARAPEPTGPDWIPPAHMHLLATLRTLVQQDGCPPSLARVCQQSGLRPWAALKQLHTLAEARAIAFSPTGYVVPTQIWRHAHHEHRS